MGEAVIVAGIGCRRGTGEADLLAALKAACESASTHLGDLTALASGEIKRDEAGLMALANTLKLPLQIVSDAALADVESRIQTKSDISLQETGSACLSEASALAAAGPGSTLLCARVIAGSATCALAQSKGIS